MAFIPNFGPIIALIPALLVAMTQSPTTALYVLILYMAVQVIESNLITPFIQREMVALPLAVIIVAQVVLGILVGGLGLILATPIVAIAMVLVRMLYIQDVLARRRYKNINGWDNYFTEGCAKL
jgi:predicted PurR-regulated permease PerM